MKPILITTALVALTACGPAPITDQTYTAGKGEPVPVMPIPCETDVSLITCEEPNGRSTSDKSGDSISGPSGRSADTSRSGDGSDNGGHGQNQGGSGGSDGNSGGSSDDDSGASDDDSTGGGTDGSPNPDRLGNPGNHKSVGRAGENPNNKGGWGGGSRGKSDGQRGNNK